MHSRRPLRSIATDPTLLPALALQRAALSRTSTPPARPPPSPPRANSGAGPPIHAVAETPPDAGAMTPAVDDAVPSAAFGAEPLAAAAAEPRTELAAEVPTEAAVEIPTDAATNAAPTPPSELSSASVPVFEAAAPLPAEASAAPLVDPAHSAQPFAKPHAELPSTFSAIGRADSAAAETGAALPVAEPSAEPSAIVSAVSAPPVTGIDAGTAEPFAEPSAEPSTIDSAAPSPSAASIDAPVDCAEAAETVEPLAKPSAAPFAQLPVTVPAVNSAASAPSVARIDAPVECAEPAETAELSAEPSAEISELSTEPSAELAELSTEPSAERAELSAKPFAELPATVCAMASAASAPSAAKTAEADTGNSLDRVPEQCISATPSDPAPEPPAALVHDYTICVATHDGLHSGTSRPVFVQVEGDQVSGAEIALRNVVCSRLRYFPGQDDADDEYLMCGGMREFDVRMPFVGNVTKIVLRLDGGEGSGEAWRPKEVVVTDNTMHRSWKFFAKGWINGDSGWKQEVATGEVVFAGRRATSQALAVSERAKSGGEGNEDFQGKLRMFADAEGGAGGSRANGLMRGRSFKRVSSSIAERPELVGVREVCFRVKKFDRDGCHMYLVGEGAELGNWKPEHGLRMSKKVGGDGRFRGEWRCRLKIDDTRNSVEYSYYITSGKGEATRCWFEGNSSLQTQKVRVLTLTGVADSGTPTRTVENSVMYIDDVFDCETKIRIHDIKGDRDVFADRAIELERSAVGSEAAGALNTDWSAGANMSLTSPFDPSATIGEPTAGPVFAVLPEIISFRLLDKASGSSADVDGAENDCDEVAQGIVAGNCDSLARIDSDCEFFVPSSGERLDADCTVGTANSVAGVAVDSAVDAGMPRVAEKSEDSGTVEGVTGSLEVVVDALVADGAVPADGGIESLDRVPSMDGIGTGESSDGINPADVSVVTSESNAPVPCAVGTSLIVCKEGVRDEFDDDGDDGDESVLSPASQGEGGEVTLESAMRSLKVCRNLLAHRESVYLANRVEKDTLEKQVKKLTLELTEARAISPTAVPVTSAVMDNASDSHVEQETARSSPVSSEDERPEDWHKAESVPRAELVSAQFALATAQQELAAAQGALSAVQASAQGIASELATTIEAALGTETALRSEVVTSRAKVQELSLGLSEVNSEIEGLRSIMAERVEEFESGTAELVRLVMDGKESRRLEVEKLLGDLDSAEQERDAALKRFALEFAERRRLFNLVQELRGNIRVFCRVRPPKDGSQVADVCDLPVRFPDLEAGGADAVSTSVEVAKKRFDFDHVFSPLADQAQVYKETSGVVGSVCDGFNVCIFAYGQTGSGKTHTMGSCPPNAGVNYRALTNLFNIAKDRSDHSVFEISVSIMEIYNEVLRDLIFEESDEVPAPPKLEIRKHPTAPSPNAVYVPGLTCVEVESVADVWDLMERGSANRAQHATDMNAHSSRSHLILSVNVASVNRASAVRSSGTLSLVDLAGSERLSRSNAEGERLKEAQHINKSLATLGDVFMGLLEKSPYIPYRNSKLTYLLQESLGGDSKTLMFVNASCDEADVNETISSLTFAQRVARVEKGAAQAHTSANGGGGASRIGPGPSGSVSSAAVLEKDSQINALQSKLVVSEREARKRVEEAEELRKRVDSSQAELKANSKILEDKKRREATESKSSSALTAAALREVKELKAGEDKLKRELAAARQKVREVSTTKEGEIRQLKTSMDQISSKLRRMELEKKGSSANTPRAGGAAGPRSGGATVPRAATFRSGGPPSAAPSATPRPVIRQRLPSRNAPAAKTFSNGDNSSSRVRFPSPKSLEVEMSTPPPSEASAGTPLPTRDIAAEGGYVPTRRMSSIPRLKTFSGAAPGPRHASTPAIATRKRVVYAFGSRVEVKEETGSAPRAASQMRPARRAATTIGMRGQRQAQSQTPARVTVNGPRRAAGVQGGGASSGN